MDLWLKIKVWTKIIIFVLVLSYVGCFTFLNMNEDVNIWLWFGSKVHPGVLSLVFYTFLAGIIGTLLFRTILRTVLQLRDLHRNRLKAQLHTDVADLKSKAAMLQTKPATPTVPPSSPRI